MNVVRDTNSYDFARNDRNAKIYAIEYTQKGGFLDAL